MHVALTIINHERREINGQSVTPALFALGEAIFRYGRIKHETLQRVLQTQRDFVNADRAVKKPGDALRSHISRLRHVLEGSGYDLKCVYDYGYQVIKVDERLTT